MKLCLCVLALLLLTGCATSRVATSIGEDIGYSFKKAAAKGEIAAEDSIKAWPYVSGLIKSTLGEDYDYKISPSIQATIDNLDTLAEQDKLSAEDKGSVIGNYVRLEYLTIVEGWDKYGISIWKAVKTFLMR